VTLHGSAAPYASVTVTISGQPTAFVTASAKGRWSTTYVATFTSRWTASVGSFASMFTTPAGTATVVPVVTSPAPVDDVIRPSSSTFTLAGLAVPLSVSVSVMHAGTVLGTSAIDGGGHWSVALTITKRTTITVVASGGVSSPTYTVIPPGG